MCQMLISPPAMDALIDHVRRGLPEEACGILVGHGDDALVRVTEVVTAVNIDPGDRRRGYQIDWRTLFHTVRRLRDGEHDIIGFYHSHPNGSPRPSRRDVIDAWPGYVYLIVPICGGRMEAATAWRQEEQGGVFEELRFGNKDA